MFLSLGNAWGHIWSQTWGLLMTALSFLSHEWWPHYPVGCRTLWLSGRRQPKQQRSRLPWKRSALAGCKIKLSTLRRELLFVDGRCGCRACRCTQTSTVAQLLTPASSPQWEWILFKLLSAQLGKTYQREAFPNLLDSSYLLIISPSFLKCEGFLK